ncbi:ABC transporter substrate-binding protein [Deltaproteobacteria bacterium]|nr:ABC transporter substrate-binding protein [Deltaproteobacteria bacterium]
MKLCKGFLAVLFVAAVMIMQPLEGSAAPKRMKVAHMTNEAYHMARAANHFRDALNATGKFKVEVYPSAVFGPDLEAIETTKAGDIDMTISPSSYFTDEVPSIAWVEVPYVFASRQEAINTLETPWGQKQLTLLNKSGLHGVGYLENGWRHTTNSKRPIHKPEDLKGLKMRTMPNPIHTFYYNSIGCSAEGSPFSELYTNLATKVFDGEENGIAHIYTSKFNEVQRYMTLTGHVYTTYFMAMNLDYWKSLTKEEQDLISKAARNAYDYQLDLIAKEDEAALVEMQNDKNHPFEVLTLTPEEHKAFMDSAKPTHEKFRKDLGAAEYEAFQQAIRDSANFKK